MTPTCRRHDFSVFDDCSICGKPRPDPVRSRRGRTNRSRGLAIQREGNSRAGLENLQGNGPKDGIAERFVSSVKSGPGWYSIRVERELDALPVRADQTAIFIAGSTPGAGHRRRIYVQMSLGDLARLVGPEAQAAVWVDDFRRLTERSAP